MSGPPPAAESAYLAALEAHWHAVLRSQDAGDEPRAGHPAGPTAGGGQDQRSPRLPDDTCRHLGAALALGELVEVTSH